MSIRLSSNYLIDTGGVDIFVKPPDAAVDKWWKVIADRQHAICEVVYWEFLRKYDPKRHDQVRQNFLSALEEGRLCSLQFDRRSAKLAIGIYQFARARLGNLATEKRKRRMNELQCDIVIAAVAVRNGKTVVTDDLADWSFIREIVVQEKLGNLPIVTLKEMRDPSKWKS